MKREYKIIKPPQPSQETVKFLNLLLVDLLIHNGVPLKK